MNQTTTFIAMHDNGQVTMEEQHLHPNGRVIVRRMVGQAPTMDWLQNVLPALQNHDWMDTLGLNHLPGQLLTDLVSRFGHAPPSTDQPPPTLNPTQYKALPRRRVTKQHQKGEFAGDTCAICLGPWKMRESITTLPCQHEFHHRCIQKWLTKNQAKCPVCRQDVTET